MTQLPDECLSEIFLNLEGQYKNLFSCLLVNRQWCRNVVPILWSEPEFFKNCKLVRTCLLALNSEERALLTSHNIMLQDDQNPFFDYPRYITAIYILTDTGIINWFKNEVVSSHNSTHVKIDSKSPKVQIIRYALTIMLLRKTEKPKYLRVYGPIHNKMVDLLAKIFIHNKTLTFLSLEDNKLTSKIRKLLVESLCKNTTLTHLDFSNNKLDSERGKILAEALGMSNTLTYLDLNNNQLGPEGGKALAKALCKNTSLNNDDQLGFNGDKIPCLSTTLRHLNLGNNKLGLEGGKALAEALCKNTTLISLYLCNNQFDSEVGKTLAEVLLTNTTLISLYLSKNNLGSEGGNALAKALSKNISLAYLDLSNNNLDSGVGKPLKDALSKNTTLISLELEGNKIDGYLDLIKTFLSRNRDNDEKNPLIF